MRHQEQTPGEEYSEEGDWDTVVLLSILRYYTPNGAKAYYDGKAATEAGQGRRRLYLRTGADQADLR